MRIDIIDPKDYPVTPMGGTEMMVERFERLVPPDLRNHIELCVTRLPLHPPSKGRPRVMWMHNSPWDTTQKLEWANVPDILDQISLWVFVSQWQKEIFLRVFPNLQGRRMVVIPNCIPAIDGKRVRRGNAGTTVRFIYTSALQRGLKELLDIFDRIAPWVDHPDGIHAYSPYELVVIGSPHTYGQQYVQAVHEQIPQEAAFLNTLYQRLERHPYIEWHPWLPQSLVVDQLLHADVWIHPGYWHETFCLAMVEALAAGCDAIIGQGRIPSALGEISKGWADVVWTDEMLEQRMRGCTPEDNYWAEDDHSKAKRHLFNTEYGELEFASRWKQALEGIL